MKPRSAPFFALALAGASLLLGGCDKPNPPAPPTPPGVPAAPAAPAAPTVPAVTNGTASPASAAVPAALLKLKGRWQRPDGGYVIEIREVQPDGKLSAAYFNPSPINVSQAEARQEAGAVKVFIELRDQNYPGATYNLTFDPAHDQLVGAYFQPLAGETYQVGFARLPPGGN